MPEAAAKKMSEKTTYYPQVEPNPNFAQIEESVLKQWKASGAFQRSIDNRADANEYVFYDGPPFANGLPHYGHLLTGYVKDLYARYHTMRGSKVDRRFGWDCHGLPAEMGAEKGIGISGRKAIEEYGIGKFNEYCRSSVMKYAGEWETYVDRQARWVDFQNDYKTMDTPFMESVLWAFKQLYDKGYIYESYRVMPYSWAAETPLSNFETKLDNSYRSRTDKAVTVKFKLNARPKGAPEAENYYLLAWTTTPWTLPSNLALAVSGEMEYVALASPSPLPLAGGAGGRVSSLAQSVGNAEFTTRQPQALEHAKELRHNTTDAENKLWYFLRGKRLEGYKFRRQHTVGKYVADFACVEQKLIIELDGSQHAENIAYDAERTAFLEEAGYRVLRFWNNELFENEEGVLSTILNALQHTPLPASPRKREEESSVYILAASALKTYAKEFEGYGQVSFKGSDLVGLSYDPLFPYFANHPNAFRVLDGSSFITEGDGTGIVHMAPGFGEDDQRVCAENGIELVVPVDESGRYTDAIFDLPLSRHSSESWNPEAAKMDPSFRWNDVPLSLKGLNVIAESGYYPLDEQLGVKQKSVERFGLVNERIARWLDKRGLLVKEDNDFKHNYPHCWRTDTPLIYRALPSWYVAVTKFRDRAVELNREINWIPEHIRDGQMGHMLATAPDWSISRNRFWGTPIPVWRRVQDSGVGIQDAEIKVFGSIAEMEEFFDLEKCLNPESRIPNPRITDLHRPYIDELKTAKDGSEWQRVTDVFDCWFESGSMPFAQVHYPFENKEWFETHFPADFITEYVGQTRGWFNTLIMLSTALFDKPPFKNCICHGVVLDAETGLKYSKRLKNYKDPLEVINQFGADALRWLMISSPVMRGSDLMVDPEGKFIRDVVRLHIKPIWNAYNFFTLYANADGVQAKFDTSSENLMDRYILAKCREAVEKIRDGLDAYDTPTACAALSEFFEVLNNWYIRRNKDRFWNEDGAATDQAAYDTLYTVLVTMCQAAAPLLPMTLEAIYQGLHSSYAPTACGGGKGGVSKLTLAQSVGNAGFTTRQPQALEHAKELHHNTTDAENKLWYFLRGKRLEGYKFRRQHTVGKYVADFACVEQKLIIELDGSQHAENAAYDAERTAFLEKAGYRVLRFWNNELFENEEGVLTTVLNALQNTPLPASPRKREEEEEVSSVHLCDFPDVSGFPEDAELIANMDRVRDICNTALSIRNQFNIRVRQPLSKVKIVAAEEYLSAIFESENLQFLRIIMDEVNTRNCAGVQDEQLHKFADRKLKLNNQILGKRLPEKMKQIIPAAKQGQWELKEGKLHVCGEVLLPEEYELNLEPKPGIQGVAALSTNDALVVLDLTITPELKREGYSRDFIRMVQQARKDANLNVSDRIALAIETSGEVAEAIAAHIADISAAVLATSLTLGKAEGKHVTEQELEGVKVAFGIQING